MDLSTIYSPRSGTEAAGTQSIGRAAALLRVIATRNTVGTPNSARAHSRRICAPSNLDASLFSRARFVRTWSCRVSRFRRAWTMRFIPKPNYHIDGRHGFLDYPQRIRLGMYRSL